MPPEAGRVTQKVRFRAKLQHFLKSVDTAAVPPVRTRIYQSRLCCIGIIEMERYGKPRISAEFVHIDCIGIVIEHTVLKLAAYLNAVNLDGCLELQYKITDRSSFFTCICSDLKNEIYNNSISVLRGSFSFWLIQLTK